MKNVDGPVLTFRIGDGAYAMPIDNVQEILSYQKAGRLPNSPSYVLGLIDLRGTDVAVIDLAGYLGLEHFEDFQSSRIIVTKNSERQNIDLLGFVVDTVLDVASIDNDSLVPFTGSMVQTWTEKVLIGNCRINGKPISIFDTEKLTNQLSGHSDLSGLEDF